MNWIAFLSDNHVEYVERGPNTKRGEVSVHCPWCGEDDPSQHLGINLEHERWGCLRNMTHRGKLPFRLIQALLGCSLAQARLVVAQYDKSDPDTLEAAIAALSDVPEAEAEVQKWSHFPPEFVPVKPSGGAARFFTYLKDRGFNDPASVAIHYNLKCCSTGYWKDRLIIPVYYKDELVGWTGRALGKPVSAPRYLTSTPELKRTVWNYDELSKGGELLFLTEGPIDALKVDTYGQSYGARATCTFGTSFTIDQISLMAELRKRFKHTVALFDPEALEETFLLTEWLPGVPIGRLPAGAEDPGALTQRQVMELLYLNEAI